MPVNAEKCCLNTVRPHVSVTTLQVYSLYLKDNLWKILKLLYLYRLNNTTYFTRQPREISKATFIWNAAGSLMIFCFKIGLKTSFFFFKKIKWCFQTWYGTTFWHNNYHINDISYKTNKPVTWNWYLSSARTIVQCPCTIMYLLLLNLTQSFVLLMKSKLSLIGQIAYHIPGSLVNEFILLIRQYQITTFVDTLTIQVLNKCTFSLVNAWGSLEKWNVINRNSSLMCFQVIISSVVNQNLAVLHHRI